ncbi:MULTISPECIES: alpha/beta hydrolase-fold protein [Mesonia]|uniref:Uncharacterized protein n=1 Tax=Mesonia oceanica TaxID=2687242 RepID=A0AC61Y3E2_9FLAO|nr:MULTISPECIES: alpha/beta hydrolase-fold protein [Mesonia]MAN26328.1 hypothetical protein [Mesonia sp.]MBJ97463.1 hypothetical protein [Flavobacteriaceae bacterium]VVU98937.1 hypothetical protein FVB9532_00186 [Mesonia oceanica]|tara:strand:- start:27354 stop:28838 length:1485 start_codon:yes stop_codon:yes gene_type:complete
MKNLIHILLFVLTANFSFSQITKTEKIFSNVIHDSIKLSIYLPENWNENKKYPVIYDFEMLSITDMNSKIFSDNILVYSKYLRLIPQTILVSIDLKNGDELGYSYQSATINEKGEKFLSAINENVFPFIESNYNATSGFRGYFGHSYGASFGNYLFLNKPSFFNSYILIAPEQLDESNPQFEINRGLINFYNNRYTTYYVAGGGKDMERRQNYVRGISQEIKKLGTDKFNFESKIFSNANHLTIIPKSIPDALEKTFELFYSFKNIDFESIENSIEYFNKINSKLNDNFEISIEKNNSNSVFFMQLAVAKQDSSALEFFANYFLSENSRGLDYYNFAYSFNTINAKKKAIDYFQKAIQRAKRDEKEKHSSQNAIDIYQSYRSIALNVYDDNPTMALMSLNEAYEDIHDIRLKYFMGKIGIQNNMKLKESVEYLKDYIDDGNNNDLWGYVSDDAYYQLGKGYKLFNKKEKSKKAFQKSLEYNPENESARKALNEL